MKDLGCWLSSDRIYTDRSSSKISLMPAFMCSRVRSKSGPQTTGVDAVGLRNPRNNCTLIKNQMEVELNSTRATT